MANYRTTISANTTGTAVITVHKPRSTTNWFATFAAYGTFGGGTLSYAFSPDGGTTKVTLKDGSGSAYSATSNDVVNLPLGVANHLGKEPIIYVVLSGATTPSITVDAYDNT